MGNVQRSNYLVYFNTMTERGLIIPTVSMAWSLFKLHHMWRAQESQKWVSDSCWQQNRIPLSMTGNSLCSVWHWGAPCQSGVAVLNVTDAAVVTLRMSSEMEPWLSHEHMGPPQGCTGAELQAGKIQNHRDLHHSIISTTCKHSDTHASAHTQFRQAKHGIWAKLKSNLSCLELFRMWSLREAKCCTVSSTMENSVV